MIIHGMQGVTLAQFSNSYGRIRVFLITGTRDTFLIKANGIIGPGILKQYLKYIRYKDRARTTRFNHIVDTSDVVMAHPLNPYYLKSISKLEHLNAYAVIVPSYPLRMLVMLFRWINRPHYVFKSMDECAKVLGW